MTCHMSLIHSCCMQYYWMTGDGGIHILMNLCGLLTKIIWYVWIFGHAPPFAILSMIYLSLIATGWPCELSLSNIWLCLWNMVGQTHLVVLKYYLLGENKARENKAFICEIYCLKMCANKSKIIIVSGDCPLPLWHIIITWTGIELLSIGFLKTNSSKISLRIRFRLHVFCR